MHEAVRMWASVNSQPVRRRIAQFIKIPYFKVIKPIRMHLNRKLYCPDNSKFINLPFLFEQLKHGNDFTVIDYENQDITLKVKESIVMDQVKKLPTQKKLQILKEIIDGQI